MKKLLFILVCIFYLSANSFAQVEKQIKGEAISAEDKKKMEDTLQGWKFGGTGNITFNQAGFKNWAAGGTNSIAFLFNLRVYADLKQGNHLWQNWVAAEYGIQISKQTNPKVSKNADRWELFSKYGYKIYKPLYVAAYVDVKSQFSKSFAERQPSTGRFDSVISKGGSPLTFEAAIGLDYVPNDKFSLFFSPFAAKMQYVADDAIAATGAYGNPLDPFSHVKKEFGAVLIAQYKQNFWKQNISVSTILKVYKNYLRGKMLDLNSLNLNDYNYSINETNSHYRKNIDVDWQTTIGFKVNKFLSASVFWQLIYDNDVVIRDKDSKLFGYKAQFRDIIGIGLSYNPNFYKAKGLKAKKI